MIYNFNNAPGASVYDVEGRKGIGAVLMVNTKTGSVVVAKQPARPNHRGQMDRETIKFDSVRPIFGGASTPCLFHCYGRNG